MSFLAWIILGLIAGFIGSKIVNKTGEGVFLDIILGIVGAIMGGWVFSLVGARGVTGVNIYSMFVAVIGAIIVLVIYHALVRRRA
ncbi:MAG: GlsB/YeaQ/YmgE family stress response membrane protein [Acidobacteriota bacterium]|nr:GlsB/YeaQ/YmgE family stress response membrane protein [Acidobacteriota bacterium]